MSITARIQAIERTIANLAATEPRICAECGLPLDWRERDEMFKNVPERSTIVAYWSRPPLIDVHRCHVCGQLTRPLDVFYERGDGTRIPDDMCLLTMREHYRTGQAWDVFMGREPEPEPAIYACMGDRDDQLEFMQQRWHEQRAKLAASEVTR